MPAIIEPYRMPIVFTLVAIAFLWGNGGSMVAMLQKLWGMIPALPTSTPKVAAATDDDSQDFLALKRLRARFDRLKCKDGTKAVDVCLQHFFHSEG